MTNTRNASIKGVQKTKEKKEQKSIDETKLKVKITTLKALTHYNSLATISKNQQVIKDASTNYGLARNLKSFQPIVDTYNENNELRKKSFGKKDDNDKVVLIDGYLVDWGDNEQAAIEELEKLHNEEVEVTIYLIKRSEATDLLPIAVLSDLLDFIIVE